MKEALQKYMGSACEVRNLQNELLFIGQMTGVEWYDDDLAIDLVSKTGDDLPLYPYDTKLRIRFVGKGNEHLIVGGRSYIANRERWRVSALVEGSNIEQRKFFRVSVHNTATVHEGKRDARGNILAIGEPVQAKLRDISMSGVRFVLPVRWHEPEGIIMSQLYLGEDREPFSPECTVCSIRTLPDGEGYEYRCNFEEMIEREEDRLCSAIFALNREEIRRRRGR